MSSGYDDRRDDRDDDDRAGRGRDRDGDDRPRRPRVDAARNRVRVPAILLIILGAIGLVIAGLNLIQLGQLPAQLDQAIAEQANKTDQNPDLTADQKQQQKQMMTDVAGFFKQALPPLFVAQLVVALLMTAGGVQMLRLASRGLAITGSVLAMIPGVYWCCFLGLPVGIWALVVLLNADVKAAFAARRRPADRDYE